MQLVYEDMPQESGSYQSKRICRWIYMETNITMDMGVKSVFSRTSALERSVKSINKSF